MAKSFDEIVSTFPTNTYLSYAHQENTGEQDKDTGQDIPKRIVVEISFSEQGFGFGSITFIQTDEGLFLDTECMSKKKAKEILWRLIDNAIIDHETDPEKHKLYNKVRGAICGGHCEICYS